MGNEKCGLYWAPKEFREIPGQTQENLRKVLDTKFEEFSQSLKDNLQSGKAGPLFEHYAEQHEAIFEKVKEMVDVFRGNTRLPDTGADIEGETKWTKHNGGWRHKFSEGIHIDLANHPAHD